MYEVFSGFDFGGSIGSFVVVLELADFAVAKSGALGVLRGGNDAVGRDLVIVLGDFKAFFMTSCSTSCCWF